MQIQNIKSTQYNNYNTNFKSIKTLEMQGLYKKNPDVALKLLKVFQQNPEAMDFCKKYNVSVFFDAWKDGYNRIKSTLCIFYENPTDNKIKKFWKFINSSEDKIQINGYKYDLEKSTNQLMDYMRPEDYLSTEGNATGLLSSNIKYYDDKIQEALNKKENIKTAKLNRKKEVADRKTELRTATDKVNDLISELIDSTKQEN